MNNDIEIARSGLNAIVYVESTPELRLKWRDECAASLDRIQAEREECVRVLEDVIPRVDYTGPLRDLHARLTAICGISTPASPQKGAPMSKPMSDEDLDILRQSRRVKFYAKDGSEVFFRGVVIEPESGDAVMLVENGPAEPHPDTVRLLNVARGCHDYGGGYKQDRDREIFHHGIQTVINALESAAKNNPDDLQVNTLERLGRAAAGRVAMGAAIDAAKEGGR